MLDVHTVDAHYALESLHRLSLGSIGDVSEVHKFSVSMGIVSK
jgi:hypothetical protein